MRLPSRMRFSERTGFPAFASLPPGKADGLLVASDPVFSRQRERIIALVVVAALAATIAGGPPVAAISATCWRTRSAASSGRRSLSAQRYSMAGARPDHPISGHRLQA